MSLATSTLKNDLLSLFEDMARDTSGDNSVFSEGVSSAIKDFIETASVTTVDAGTISAGAFVGTGTGTISADATECESIIQAACEAMVEMTSGGNSYLAERIEAGVQAMSDAAVVSCDVTGTVTTTTGTTSTVTGSATGSIACSYDLAGDLEAVFEAMVDMTSGGAEYMAAGMAAACEAFVLSGVVSTDGESTLAGSAGSGAAA